MLTGGVFKIKPEDLVLKDIELCKQVQPIMERLGIGPDACWDLGGQKPMLICQFDMVLELWKNRHNALPGS